MADNEAVKSQSKFRYKLQILALPAMYFLQVSIMQA